MEQTRRTRVSGIALVAIAAGLAVAGLTSCGTNPRAGGEAAKPATAPAAMTHEQLVERGTYLVKTSGVCKDCHTPGGMYGAPDASRQLAGSELGWTGPWGTSYASNLTPDPETGIGSWSEEDIVKAIQKGVKPDGTPVLPPMPWPNLAGLNFNDAHAIAAYLKTIPPVKHKVPAALPPGRRAASALVIPPPPAWDAPKGPPPGAPAGAPAGGN
jgi:mono/diheme cytochrome c family protein